MNPSTEVTAAILAGGLGTRLRAAVGSYPKVLALVRDRPYVTYLFDRLADAAFREVVLLTGYRADEVARVLGQSYRGMRLVYSPEPTPLGTGGALRRALPRLTAPLVLLMNGDSYCEVDLADFREFHHRQAADFSLALANVDDVSRYGQVQTAVDGRVVRFGEKELGGAQGWVNGGIYLLKRTLVEKIPDGRPVSLERELLPAWARDGTRVYGYHCDGRFIDIGTPESLAEAEAFFQPRIGSVGPTAGPS